MTDRASSARIVLASSFLADYAQGGGLWSWILQYLLGLRALGHDAFVFELLSSSGDPGTDELNVEAFFRRLARYGLRDRAVLLLAQPNQPFELESVAIHGGSAERVRELAQSADFLWNVSGSAGEPVLSLFRRRVLIDADPGIYQLSAQQWDMGLDQHEVLLTVGTNVGAPDCEAPTLGRTWHTFRPFVYLPAWPAAGDPGPTAPFTSVTQWRWDDEVFEWRRGLISTSKREAYLRYLDLPRRAGRPFELAVNLHPDDDTGDREMLAGHGWGVVHPEKLTDSPESYRRFIERSRAEFACVKPIYSALRTGWFSDRSVCYLASGRPVVCEHTGLAAEIPVGEGLLTFASIEQAVSAVAEVDARYREHARAARELAETLFDATTCLTEMIALSG